MENLQTYKKELISDLIINGVSSSIELEKRLDRLIVLALGGEKGCPFDEPLPDVKYIIGVDGPVKEIKPEDMVKGEWYKLIAKHDNSEYIFKFKSIHKLNDELPRLNYLLMSFSYRDEIHIYKNNCLFYNLGTELHNVTREEVTKYFPHEFEIDFHGGNDLGFICPASN